MTQLSSQILVNTLASVTYGNINLSESKFIASAVMNEDVASIVLEMPPTITPREADKLQKQCEKALRKIKGVKKVNIVITTATPPAPSVSRPAPPSPKPIPGVRRTLAIAAGKGGVGKSTVAVNLAVALSNEGYKVGLVDADIYGPSVGRMLGWEEEPATAHNKMLPPERFGVKCTSMGMLLKENSPAVWRGPMATKALAQLVLGAEWGELDYLLFDLPPGTGDIHLSLVQNFTLSAALLVATPQEIALMDVRKAAGMFRKVGVPVLGVVENMAYFEDPASGMKHYLFGQGGVAKMAEQLGLDVLAQLPVMPALSTASDAGIPLATSMPDHPASRVFKQLAEKVVERVPQS